MTLPGILSTLCGVCLLGLVASDVYATILHSRTRAGPIGETSTGARGGWLAASPSAFRARDVT